MKDADAHQPARDDLEHRRFIDAVRQGLRESEQRLGRTAEEVFAERKAKYGLSDGSVYHGARL